MKMKSALFTFNNLFLPRLSIFLFHEGKPHTWHDLIRAWSFEPLVMFSLVLAAVAFAIGGHRLWQASPKHQAIKSWEVLCFVGGWLALFVALVSPLHAWGEVLFSAHMAQHEILMLVAAPLLVLGRPQVAFLRALPVAWAHALVAGDGAATLRRAGHALGNPLLAWAIHAVTLWAWHAPALFDAAVRHEFVHALQHLSFFGTAVLFWWSVLERSAERALGYGA